MDDAISRKLAEIEWRWGDKDAAALAILEDRIGDAGSQPSRITINYSELVRGINFTVPTLHGGKPYEIDVDHWTELDRALIGDFLGVVSARSYERAKFMASALVVLKDERKPSWHFFQWMEMLGVLPNLDDDTVLAFWIEQVNKAHEWFKVHYRVLE